MASPNVENRNKKIVVTGAGYGGITSALRAARLFRRHPDVQVHLIDRNPYHLLKTHLHEAAVHQEEVAIPIERLVGKRNIRFHLAEVTGIDPEARVVHLQDGTLPFDYLVVALGSQTNFYNIPGLQDHALTLETLADAHQIHDHIARLCARASSEPDETRRRNLLRFVIGGGGLSGVEFAAEFAEHAVHCTRHYRIDRREVEIILVEAGNRIMPNLEEAIAATVAKELREKGVKVLDQMRITGQTAGEVTLSSGEVLPTETLVWTGGIHITDLFRESGMKIGRLGRIAVDEFLRAESYPHIYAIGDNALAINPRTGNPVPTAAQFALQQGRLVADNIYAAVTGGKQEPYSPRVRGEVVSLGKHLAAGWLALPFAKKITFVGFLGSLIKAAIEGKHVVLLRKESRKWWGE
jgi:NADH:ubiquinone reductase (H+-translocating)